MAERGCSCCTYPFAEDDWPVMLTAHIVVRQRQGVKAHLTFCDSWPPHTEEKRLRAVLEGDSRDRSLSGLEKALTTLLEQIRRQYAIVYDKQ